MNVDRDLLDYAVRTGSQRPVLRIYRWKGPVLSIGVHQRLSEELVSRCDSRSVEIVRRPTGGTAVLHDRDLTYCVVAPSGRMGVLEAYRWVAEGLIDGLGRLGLTAEVGGTRQPSQPAATLGANSACFAASVRADLHVGESKICGSAQVRKAGWLLQHGSIPLADTRELTRELLRHPGPNPSTCIEHLRPGTSWEELAECLVQGFAGRWGGFREAGLKDFSPVERAVSL